MSAASWVLTILLAVYFIGLFAIIALDPAHLLDAWKRGERR